jgi:RNA polymerase sigma factor (sigma-70 family)
MPLVRNAGACQHARVLFGAGTLAGLTDGELLERFAMHRADDGEVAFAALLDRHGPMVLGVCGSLLKDPNDAEDAFQATFLVLARKARSLWVRGTIGPWLHGVAYRIAIRALSDRARRRRHEGAAAGLATTAVGPSEPDEFGAVLHEELGRLPESFRVPIVLCYLEGLTHDQAAHRLGWPVGTVRSRLFRGRERLRSVLHGRGVGPAVVPLISASGARAAAIIRPSLAVSTTRAAGRMTSGLATAGMAPAVISMTQGVLRTMMLKTMTKIAVVIVATGLLVTGVAAIANQASGAGQEPTTAPSPTAPAPAVGRAAVPPKSEAETIAEKFLKAGSDLFDAKDAVGLAATYTEDGEIVLVDKKDGEIHNEVKQGRADIEKLYRDLFHDAGAIDSENAVEFARLISPELLVVHGRFRPDVGKPDWPFVQMRVKHGDRWLLSKLWLFLKPEN